MRPPPAGVLAALLLAFAAPVFAPVLAQGGGASFDCGRAGNDIERAICKDAALAKADRELAATYTALLGRLSGPARDELVKDQVRWIADRNRACTLDTDGAVPCLKRRYAAREANLEAFGRGVYPFVSQQALILAGKVGKIAWSYDIAYPQFDGQTADFAALNASFADAARKAAADATPKPDDGVDREQAWSYEQDFEIDRPSPHAVTVALDFYGYSGGAHGYGATRCTLVDLRTGKAVGPRGVFADGDQWLKTLLPLVTADLRRQFVDKPGFDDALEPANLGKLLHEAQHYCWRPDRLELIFNAYEVGPYVSGPFEVNLPYDELKPLLRPDGPIAP